MILKNTRSLLGTIRRFVDSRYSQPRALPVAILAVFLAAVIFHQQLSCALVTRGDDELGRSHTALAERMYRRALLFTPHDGIAVERLVFAEFLSQDPSQLRDALTIARHELYLAPAAIALRIDAALCAQRLGDMREAERDYALAGAASGDPRYYYVAAKYAHIRGDDRAARTSLRAALKRDPDFIPARTLQAKLTS